MKKERNLEDLYAMLTTHVARVNYFDRVHGNQYTPFVYGFVSVKFFVQRCFAVDALLCGFMVIGAWNISQVFCPKRMQFRGFLLVLANFVVWFPVSRWFSALIKLQSFTLSSFEMCVKCRQIGQRLEQITLLFLYWLWALKQYGHMWALLSDVLSVWIYELHVFCIIMKFEIILMIMSF